MERSSSRRDGLDVDAFDELRSAGYEVTRLLGRGGMGVVYQAHQVALNRAVALKLIRTGSFASEAEVLRFQNEAEAVAQLDHPHIVPIYEVGRHGRHHFFSMKLIAGTSLDKRLEEFVADPRAAARLVAVAAEAIHHAHQRGILHRDLKPANILVDEHGEPHVTDFGLAKRHRRRLRDDAFERPDRDAVVHVAGAGHPGGGRSRRRRTSTGWGRSCTPCSLAGLRSPGPR